MEHHLESFLGISPDGNLHCDDIAFLNLCCSDIKTLNGINIPFSEIFTYTGPVIVYFYPDLLTEKDETYLRINNTQKMKSSAAFGDLKLIYDQSICVGGGICFRGIYVYKFNYDKQMVNIRYNEDILDTWFQQLVDTGRLPKNNNLTIYNNCCDVGKNGRGNLAL